MDPNLLRLQRALSSAVHGMSPEQLARRPAEGKWSAAEILEHLYRTFTGTAKGFERCLQAGKPLVSPATRRQRFAALLVVGFGHMPRGRQAPQHTLPRGLPAETVLSDLEARIAAMDQAIRCCEQQYGRKAKLLDHPILGPLTGRQWRKFHRVHGEHHARQILRLRQKQ
ncbi:MAG TPA: DUF1569 domain-containing protein [Terriglobales bacterium]|nr:DUF1569 domain-containing protein [Terriglobales bacterium]